ncbi:MAG TPA: sigma-70 family RNA polymerase sigma factor, partial [Chitinophagales bacterium]|nr:sigma-70 family RNA polymerase sigma factor [Chitinophagales bacterium]
KDARLTTYSIYWIDQSISRNIADFGFTIRLPVHYFEQANYVMRLFIKNPELSRDQIAEIAMEERDVSPSEFARLMNTIETIMSLASLNSFVGDQQDSELVEFIEDDTAPSVEDEVDLILLRKAISLALDTLKSREQLVISLRFGLRDGRRLTLEQIGKILGVTRERVRQIEQKAFRKLKHPSRSKDLQEFYYQG